MRVYDCICGANDVLRLTDWSREHTRACVAHNIGAGLPEALLRLQPGEEIVLSTGDEPFKTFVLRHRKPTTEEEPAVPDTTTVTLSPEQQAMLNAGESVTITVNPPPSPKVRWHYIIMRRGSATILYHGEISHRRDDPDGAARRKVNELDDKSQLTGGYQYVIAVCPEKLPGGRELPYAQLSAVPLRFYSVSAMSSGRREVTPGV